ncbi:MAG: hypothetical protein KKD65_12865 [Gammaproteobacteria bacterium]|nr:hypothetical protein [Gammaproteobacteria bacterium]
MYDIHINRFRSTSDNLVRESVVDWDVLVDFLQDFQIYEDKSMGRLFNAAHYKSVEDIEAAAVGIDYDTGIPFAKRLKSNILAVDLLVLDYDGTMTIEAAKDRFSAYEYVGYTSFRHLENKDVHKFRLVFLLSEPIPADCQEDELGNQIGGGVWYSIIDGIHTFAGDCDPASLNPNQLYYVPAAPQDRIDRAVAWHNKGKPLDWSQFPRNNPVFDKSARVVSGKQTTKGEDDQFIRPDDLIQTRKGVIRAGDVTGKVEGVSCPFHADKNGSEFIKKSPAGNIFLHCRHCGKSFYVREEESSIAKAVQAKKQDRFVDDKIYTLDDMIGAPNKVFQDARSRAGVIKQLDAIEKEIVKKRFTSQGYNIVLSHLIYLPEGAGKSRLAVNLAKKKNKILFACKSWDQAFKKYDEYSQLALETGFKVVLYRSKDAKARRRFGVPVERGQARSPFDTGKILDEESVQAFIKNRPDLNPEFIKLAWRFFTPDRLSFERISPPSEEEEEDEDHRGSIDVSEEGGVIVVTTFAQLRIMNPKKQFVPKNWIVWFDDPDISDVIDIDPYTTVDWGWLPEQEVESKTIDINGRLYFRRNEKQSLGYVFARHRRIYTTTEIVTKEAIQKMAGVRKDKFLVHDKMNNIAGGEVTILGTRLVQKKFDGIIPLVARRLTKSGFATELIADGLGATYNHMNSKGQNALNKTNILVELSIPHPAEIRTVCDALGKSYSRDRDEVTKARLLDKMHQAIGRNSGFRYKGFECVVLVDKSKHRHIAKECRYLTDEKNSVVIDRTQTMGRKTKRTAGDASDMVVAIETLLNNFNAYAADNRKIKPDITYVVKSIKNDSERVAFIARMLMSFTTMSGVKFDDFPNCPEPDHDIGKIYWELGNWVLSEKIPPESVKSALEKYINNIKETESY